MIRSILVTLLCAMLCLIGATRADGSTLTVGQYQAISIPVPHSQAGVRNVWDDVTVTAKLTAPDRSIHTIGGFYHSTDLWMVRYAPDQIGTWNYTITVNDRGTTFTQDSFRCVASNEPGFIYCDEMNFDPLRWIYSNGKPFFGIGFGDCMQAPFNSIFDNGYIDGGFRTAGLNSVSEWIIPYSQYLIAYGDVAGFNLYRYSDGNCAYSIVKSINASGNNFDTLHSLWTDTLFQALRQHGFRIYMTMFGSPVGKSTDTASMAATLRYVQYCINRYGGLIDFWELTNESTPDSLWTYTVAQFIRTHDPYKQSSANGAYAHRISISWEQPKNIQIDIISPHWYGKEDVRTSDQVTADKINQSRSYYKSVVFGEQGEGGWDSLSSTRMRGRIWSALFNEGTIIFWNTSFAKDCPCNQYLGWEERRNVRVLSNFSRLLGIEAHPITDTLVVPRTVGACRIWGMNSYGPTDGYNQLALYIRNDQDVNAMNTGLSVPINLEYAGKALWYDVHTGDVLERMNVQPGQQVFKAPDFKTDIAFLAGSFTDSLIVVDSLFRLNVTPRTFSLLNVPVKSAVTVPIGLRNTGTGPITIQEGRMTNNAAGYFTLGNNPFPLTIAPADSQTIFLHYTPRDTGIHLTMLSLVRTGSPAWENIAVAATATASAGVEIDERAFALPSIVPDPASDFVIVPAIPSTTLGESISAQIFSVSGAKVLEVRCHVGERINIKGLGAGTYHLRFLNAEQVIGNFVFVLLKSE